MEAHEIQFLTQLARGIARQFGPNCEIVVHDLKSKEPEQSIVAIENGHITGRQVGDGPSRVVWEALKADPSCLEDRLAYLTKTEDGRILKSSTIFHRDAAGNVNGILAINYDITAMKAVEDTLRLFTSADTSEEEPRTIVHSVSDLLEELIEQSARLVGKPVELMDREDKIRAVRFLNDSGAFLITKSGPRVCSYFGISKYTLYSYIGEVKGGE